MGPGRLTGMNAWPHRPAPRWSRAASMGPGRLTGMNAAKPPDRARLVSDASMGPGRLTGMNARHLHEQPAPSVALQWGPVD